MVFFTGLIIRNSLIYFSEPRAHGFVWAKGALADRSLWMGMLIVHVAAGLVCLVSSFLQFCRPLLRRLPQLHRWLGRIYVGSILLVLSPTGFYLAFFAHGGPAGVAGFLLLGVLTTVSTWKGWIAMRRGRTREHIIWMVRSFAMATSAISFRLVHVALQFTPIDPDRGFLIALYASIAGNALVAELLLGKIRARKPKTKIEHHEQNHPKPVHTH